MSSVLAIIVVLVGAFVGVVAIVAAAKFWLWVLKKFTIPVVVVVVAWILGAEWGVLIALLALAAIAIAKMKRQQRAKPP